MATQGQGQKPCGECHAPAGKPHATSCSQRTTQGGAPTRGAPAQGGTSTAITTIQQKVLDIGKLIEAKRDALALVAGKHFDADRLVKLGQAAITRNPKLALCNTATVLVCLMRAAELNLEPDAALPQRRIWLVPRKNKNLPEGMEATYVIDFRAKVQLARDTGLVPSITADVVYTKDKFTYRKSVDGESITKIEHEPDVFAEERGDVRGYYAAARLAGGEVQAVVWSLAKMQRFRGRHASAGDGPWSSDFDAMALKTMLNQLFNLLPAGESVQARRLQEISKEEEEVETTGRTVGTTTGSSGAVDLGITMPAEPETTGEQVERALAGPGNIDEQRLPDEVPKEDAKPASEPKEKSNPKKAREPGEEG